MGKHKCEETEEKNCCSGGCCESEETDNCCTDSCDCGCNETDDSNDKLNDAFNQISLLEDALLRNKAEFVNYRKRLEEETARTLKFKNEGLIKDLLPIVDNFERAIKMETEENQAIISGFKMIYTSLIEILNKNEVKEIECLNQPFDANMHQAVIQEAKEGVESDIVIEVLQKGYILKDKVVRPAMVKVSQ